MHGRYHSSLDIRGIGRVHLSISNWPASMPDRAESFECCALELNYFDQIVYLRWRPVGDQFDFFEVIGQSGFCFIDYYRLKFFY